MDCGGGGGGDDAMRYRERLLARKGKKRQRVGGWLNESEEGASIPKSG